MSNDTGRRRRLGHAVKLAPIETELDTLQERVYRQLRTVIMSGELEPGQRLSYRGLAGKLGTSIMPVRDAVRRLVAENALVVFPNRTIGIPLPAIERISQVYKIREVLEGLAAWETAQSINKKEIERLRKMEAKLEKLHRKPDFGPYLKANQQFHFQIYSLSGMPQLIRMIEALWLQIGPLLNYTRTTLPGKVIFTHHQDVIKAFAKGDADAAKAAMQEDIRDAGSTLIAHLEEIPEG